MSLFYQNKDAGLPKQTYDTQSVCLTNEIIMTSLEIRLSGGTLCPQRVSYGREIGASGHCI